MNEYSSRNKALILLQDGTIFFGKSLGVKGNAYGELCFNTGMTGYQEIFTDPSYFEQLMLILVIMELMQKKLNQIVQKYQD